MSNKNKKTSKKISKKNSIALKSTQSSINPINKPKNITTGISNILLKSGFITQQQLTHAIRVKSKITSEKSLLTVMKELNMITSIQLQKALRANKLSWRIGELLVELEYLNEKDLDKAFAIQKNSDIKKRIGEILIDERFIDSKKFAEVLAYQLGIDMVEPNLEKINMDLIAKIPYKLYSKYRFIPVKKKKRGSSSCVC